MITITRYAYISAAVFVEAYDDITGEWKYYVGADNTDKKTVEDSVLYVAAWGRRTARPAVVPIIDEYGFILPNGGVPYDPSNAPKFYSLG